MKRVCRLVRVHGVLGLVVNCAVLALLLLRLFHRGRRWKSEPASRIGLKLRLKEQVSWMGKWTEFDDRSLCWIYGISIGATEMGLWMNVELV